MATPSIPKDISNLIKHVEDNRYNYIEQHKYCEQILKHKNIKEYPYAYAFALIFNTSYLRANKEYTLLFNNLYEARKIASDYNYQNLLALVYGHLGNQYLYLHDYNNALDNYLNLRKVNKARNNIVDSLIINNNIGNLYLEQGDYKTALEYFLNAEKDLFSPNIDKRFFKLYGNTIYTNIFSCLIHIKGRLEDAKESLSKARNYLDETNFEDKLFLLTSEASIALIENDKETAHNRITELVEYSKVDEHLIDNYDEVEKQFFKLLLQTGDKDFIIDITKQVIANKQYDFNSISSWNVNTFLIRFLEQFDSNNEHLLFLYRKNIEFLKLTKQQERINTCKNFNFKISAFNAKEENEQLLKQQQKYKQMSVVDELTKIANRRGLVAEMRNILKHSLNSQKEIGIILFDIDYFKEYNDNYSHLSGDKVLKHFASLLKRYATTNIFPARFGGDEFMCIISDSDEQSIKKYVEKIQCDLEKHPIEHLYSKGDEKRVTFSAGYISLIPQKGTTSNQLISKCDVALYIAKEKGRNRYIGNIDLKI